MRAACPLFLSRFHPTFADDGPFANRRTRPEGLEDTLRIPLTPALPWSCPTPGLFAAGQGVCPPSHSDPRGHALWAEFRGPHGLDRDRLRNGVHGGLCGGRKNRPGVRVP